ncbi:unnamed protein product, partial [Hapterophycus canaliculatus]
TSSAPDISKVFLTCWQQNINGAADSDASIRKVAMRRLTRDLHESLQEIRGIPASMQSAPSAGPQDALTSFVEEVMSLLMEGLAKVIFQGLSDSAQACSREASIQAITLFVGNVSDLTPYLAYLFPVLVARGVPAGSLYDPALELFVYDNDEHEAYKRGRATERQDRHIPHLKHITEESEELRLSLCRMIGRMLASLMERDTIGVLRPYLDDTILLLVSLCRDPYSTVAAEALSTLSKLVVHPHLEQGMKFYAVGLCRVILPLLRHRHAKVRIHAIEALRVTVMVPDRAKVKGAGTSAIVDLVGFREDNVLPVAAFYGKGDTMVNYLAELTTDRSASVRAETALMLSEWLTSLPDRYDHQTRLLPYVLNAIADNAEVVSTIALETLSKCGAEYEREHEDDVIERRQFGVDGDFRANHSKPLPRPFSGRPRIGARLYVRNNTRRFLKPLLVEMSNWRSETRLRSTLLFRTLVVYCEEHLTVETHKLIPHFQQALQLAISGKDEALKNALLDCCELVGRYVVPESYLPHMMSRIKEEPEINPTGNRATLLMLLWKLLEGSLPTVVVPHVAGIVDVVTARSDDIAGETAAVRLATIKVLSVMASSLKLCGSQATEERTFASTGRLAAMKRPIKSAIKFLLACRRLDDSPFETDLVLGSLAAASGMATAEQLIAANAEDIINEVSEVFPCGPVWIATCSPQLILESLLSLCPQAPRICPPLLRLCTQIVTFRKNFPDGCQEAVLATVVARVLKAVNVWECSDDLTKSLRSAGDVPVEYSARSMLKLCLHSCWSTNPELRRCQIDIIGAVVEDQSWRQFLSTFESQSGSAETDVMSAVLGLLDHKTTERQEYCKILSLVSQVLRMSTTRGSCARTHGRSVLPFSRREHPVDLRFSNMAASAFPRVLARADDDSDDVRQSALQTLQDLLPFVQPDSSCRQRPCSGAKEENSAISNAIDNPWSVRWETLKYKDFVTDCVKHAIHSTSNCINGLELFLRKSACLDPGGFTSVLAR